MPGGRGDALLGAGVDDEARLADAEHGRREGLDAVDDAPEIDVEQPLPGIAVFPGFSGSSPTPALFITSATPPKALCAFCASRSTSVRLGDIGGDGEHGILAPAIVATARAAASKRAPPMSASTIFMPMAASRLAAARPMPLALPVMTATLPEARAGKAVWISASLVMILSLFGVAPNLASDAPQASLSRRLRVDHTVPALVMLRAIEEGIRRLTDWMEVLKAQADTGDQLGARCRRCLPIPRSPGARSRRCFRRWKNRPSSSRN